MATEEMAAGPALDAEVDRLLFGKGWRKSDYVVINGVRMDVETWLPDDDFWSADDPPGGWTWGETPPRYSTRIEDAWKVVERMGESGACCFKINREYIVGHTQTDVTITMQGEQAGDHTVVTRASAETAPLAICRAALLARRAAPGAPAAEGGEG